MKHTAAKLPTSLADQAVWMQAQVQARRVPCCAMCSSPRRVVVEEGERYVVCDRCRDWALVGSEAIVAR